MIYLVSQPIELIDRVRIARKIYERHILTNHMITTIVRLMIVK